MNKNKKENSKEKITCPLCRLRMKKDEQKFVQWSELIKDEKNKTHKKDLVIPFGRTPAGRNILVDFVKLPHLLIGGTIGSGKTVFMRSLIASLVKKFTTKELKFVLANYDETEFSVFGKSPYLFFPVIKTTGELMKVTSRLVDELDRRYELLQEKRARNINAYNKKSSVKMPYIFLIIEELAAFTPAEKDVKKRMLDKLIQIPQVGRAVGIHMVVSSVRLGSKVFPDLLAGNLTSRLAFQTITVKDSRNIMYYDGAEKLQGRGDAYLSYFVGRKAGDVRIQTPMITKKELKDVLKLSTTAK